MKKRDKAFAFTYSNLKREYELLIQAEYDICTCRDYLIKKKKGSEKKVLVNRVDVDLSVKKAERIVDIFNYLNIKATFFIRLHAPEYNFFSFENYRILKKIKASGHEIGYHSEIIDQSEIWNEDAENNLIRDLNIINLLLDENVVGVASHGGMTGLNNLDFWKDKKATDYGLLYEAYDTNDFDIFNNSFYISDSSWTAWKCYKSGIYIENDKRSPSEHIIDDHRLIYLLIHPDTYYDNHIYE